MTSDKNQSGKNQNQIDETMNKTELGHWLLEHKNGILISIVILAAVIFGAILYMNIAQKNLQKDLARISKFKDTTLNSYIDEKSKKDELVIELEQVLKDVGDRRATAQLLVEVTQALHKNGQVEDAIKYLEKAWQLVKKNDYASYVIASNLAVLYEENKQYKKASELLEKIVQAKNKVYEPKLYLDLGRLYNLQGNDVKAQLNWKYVVDNFPNDELSNIAQIYLNELKINEAQ